MKRGLTFISQGKMVKARQILKQTYKKYPNSAKAQLAYAHTIEDGLKAQILYRKVVKNHRASDSLKSEALVRLGYSFYIQEKYDSASFYFHQAGNLTGAFHPQHLQALTAFNQDDIRKPESIWLATITKGNQDSPKALYYLGNSFYRQKKYEEAYNCYYKAAKLKKQEWTVPALVGAYLSSVQLGDSLKSKQIFGELKNQHPTILEADLIQSPTTKITSSLANPTILHDEDFGSISQENKEIEQNQKKIKPFPSSEPRFTLQIGAFTAVENAQNLYQEMNQKYDQVTIKTVKIMGITYHKVRIGSFASKEMALAYGEKYLSPKNLKFRAVKE